MDQDAIHHVAEFVREALERGADEVAARREVYQLEVAERGEAPVLLGEVDCVRLIVDENEILAIEDELALNGDDYRPELHRALARQALARQALDALAEAR
jgi:hypothetical protein